MNYWQMTCDLLGGLGVSVQIFAYTLLLALPFGFVVALGRMSRNVVVSGFFRILISVVRGTPLMLQIMFVYCSDPRRAAGPFFCSPCPPESP